MKLHKLGPDSKSGWDVTIPHGVPVMIRKSLLAAAVVSFATAGLAADHPAKKAPAPVVAAPMFFVNDNTISYSYQFNATDPGIKGKFGKNVFSFTHFDVWAMGTNFFTVDLLKSPSADPTAPCMSASSQCGGATEIYGLFRSTLGFNQVFGAKAFSMGPLSNVSFEVGADFNSENNYLAPAKKSLVAGLQFSFDLPYKGFFNVSPLYFKEWNHNAYTVFDGVPGGNTEFDGTWAVETVYVLPLGFMPAAVPLTFSGRAAFYGPKGTGASQLRPTPANKTVTTFNSEQRLTLDVGKMAFGASKADLVSVFVAYRYWTNKFGVSETNNAGVCKGVNAGSCKENAATLGVNVKF